MVSVAFAVWPSKEFIVHFSTYNSDSTCEAKASSNQASADSNVHEDMQLHSLVSHVIGTQKSNKPLDIT